MGGITVHPFMNDLGLNVLKPQLARDSQQEPPAESFSDDGFGRAHAVFGTRMAVTTAPLAFNLPKAFQFREAEMVTDIGLNVSKPDRVIGRLVHRLGLLESEEQIFKAILEGRSFAEATGLPIRYIDIVLVVFGQIASPQVGISKGVCLNEPRCGVCAIKTQCSRLGVAEQA